MTRRVLPLDEMDKFERDDDGRLYWAGRAVILERRIGLEGPTFWGAVAAATATVVQALWTILDRFDVSGL